MRRITILAEIDFRDCGGIRVFEARKQKDHLEIVLS